MMLRFSSFIFLLNLFFLNFINASNITDAVKEEKTIVSQQYQSHDQTINEYDELISAATSVRENAYAPYSKFKVGAAVMTHDGKIFSACNVENASYGLTICAERNAIFKAISEGYHTFKAIAIVLDDDDCRPCGACRQVIREFGSDIDVIMKTINGKLEICRISELYPKAFVLEQNKK